MGSGLRVQGLESGLVAFVVWCGLLIGANCWVAARWRRVCDGVPPSQLWSLYHTSLSLIRSIHQTNSSPLRPKHQTSASLLRPEHQTRASATIPNGRAA